MAGIEESRAAGGSAVRLCFWNLPLELQPAILTPEMAQIHLLRARETVVPLAPIAAGLGDPVPDHLAAGLELPGQFLGCAARPDQVTQLLTILRRGRASSKATGMISRVCSFTTPIIPT